MSKELTALEKLCDIALCDCSTNELNRVANYKNIIETALKNDAKERDHFESKYHCPLSVLEEAHDSGKIFSVWLDDYIDVFQIVLWEQATRPYILCKYRRKRSKKIEEKLIFVDEYQKTWYLKKEGKHE